LLPTTIESDRRSESTNLVLNTPDQVVFNHGEPIAAQRAKLLFQGLSLIRIHDEAMVVGSRCRNVSDHPLCSRLDIFF
jgi:hypothetical protein